MQTSQQTERFSVGQSWHNLSKKINMVLDFLSKNKVNIHKPHSGTNK
jgi:hypothetical protein